MREAGYHFGGTEGGFRAHLDSLYKTVQDAKEEAQTTLRMLQEDLQGQPCSVADCPKASWEEELMGRAKLAAERAMITSTEAYFVEVLTTVPGPRQGQKIRTRITQLGTHKIDPSKILPILWQRVTSVAAGGEK